MRWWTYSASRRDSEGSAASSLMKAASEAWRKPRSAKRQGPPRIAGECFFLHRSIVILPLHVPPEGCRFSAGDEFEAAHPSPIVGQWHALCGLGAVDFGKKHRVRPARHFLDHAALDGGQRVTQERSAELSIRDAHAAELIRMRPGELEGDLALILPQNVHSEDLRLG